MAAPLVGSFLRRGGAPLGERAAGVRRIVESLSDARHDPRQDASKDPLARTRDALQSDPDRLEALEAAVRQDIDAVVFAATQEISS